MIPDGKNKPTRMTVINPDRRTYRMPGTLFQRMEMKMQQGIPAYYGDPVDKLGAYEELGDVEYIRRLVEEDRKKQALLKKK